MLHIILYPVFTITLSNEIDSALTQMIDLSLLCFLKVDAAGRRIIVSKNTSLRKKKKHL